ncbi:hypothetical protein LCGC14_0632780 [marine sediment metagenome]|uniref:site-specific DNA-methyltransferase (cytosine-N(4)-specific) n=1 Tax=marine sediment metagenome TaxID=412755 RepID=A0A0F9RKX6_9ZZZZ
MKTNIILQGDSLEQLKTLPDESIDCVMTSPPYWALRDYGVEGQLGLESTFEEYINKLCDIFDEVKRVLKKTGTCWVNLGDTYYGSGKGAGGDITDSKQVWGFENKTTKNCEHCGKEFEGYAFQKFCGSACSGVDNTTREKKGELKDKCLTLIPMRFAIEMVNRGWILRNNIIWQKPNCMPSSANDRFTVDFEYIFFFTKNKKYFFEQQIEETGTHYIRKISNNDKKVFGGEGYAGDQKANREGRIIETFGRNKRTVWPINPKPYKEAHFAVFPEELCETPLKAGCPSFVCIKCGNPKFPIYTPSKEYEKLLKSQRKTEAYTSKRREEAIKVGNAFGVKKVSAYPDYKISFEQTCNCNVEFTGGVVLDPFFGSGTTGVVALKQQKKFIGIELNPEYIEIANKRLKPHLEQRKL